MYYYSKNSLVKVFHNKKCPCIHRISADNMGEIASLFKAHEQGYKYCMLCNPLFKHYREHYNEILGFAIKNGITIRIEEDRLSVWSVKSQWKIVLDKNDKMVLYHNNSFRPKNGETSKIKGYHLQKDVREDSIVKYLEYIVEHDYYRMLNPAYINAKKKAPKHKKGTNSCKIAKKKQARYDRGYAIKRVRDLIDSLEKTRCTAQNVSI